MENFESYVKPELLIVIAVLYFLGSMLKSTEKVSDKYIPMILGIVGILICSIYVVGTEGFSLTGVFTAITQGVLVGGASVYANQLIKQSSK